MKKKFSGLLKREAEVAFSRNAQPTWVRVLKYVVLGALISFFWGREFLWVMIPALLLLGLLIHFWYRYKTNGWTKSYGSWDYEKNKPGGGN